MNIEEQYLECFNNFIKKLQIIFTDKDINDILNNIYNFENEKKIYNGLLFVSLLNDEYFDLFINNKIKLFSYKNSKTQEISDSLFGSILSLKNLLNNQPDDIKKIIWFYLHSIYYTIEKTKSIEIQNINRLIIINKLINDNPNMSKDKFKEFFNADVNNETSDMINDIMESFDSIINNSNDTDSFNNIIDISQKIAVKYNGKIANGDIELDKILSSVSQKIPGMEKIMNQMSGITQMTDGLLGGNKKSEEKVLIDENFSTSSVPIGKVEENQLNNFKIGNILKIADDFGVLPGNKLSNDNLDESNNENISNDEDINIKNIPHIGKMMDMIQKLTKTSTLDDPDKLKQEMNSFLQNDMGIDINNFNEQLEEITQKISKLNENENENEINVD